MAQREEGFQDLFEEELELNPYLKVIPVTSDEIVVKHGSRSPFTRIINDDSRSKLLGKVLRNLTQPTTLKHLWQRNIFKEEELENALKLVNYLHREGVLIKPTENLSRIYLSTVLGGNNLLSTFTIGIIGVGYLGSRIAEELVDLDVGKLIVLDDRRVKEEKIDQLYFNLFPNTIKAEHPYVKCLQDYFEQRGFKELEIINAAFDDQSTLQKVADKANFLIIALEAFSSKILHIINKVALDSEKPWILIYFDGSEVHIGPLFIPGETCCYNCYEVQHEATITSVMRDTYLLYKETISEEGIASSSFVIPPYLNIASGFGTTGIIHFLLSGKSFLVGHYICLDLERLMIERKEVLRLPRCPACNSQRASYRRHIFM